MLPDTWRLTQFDAVSRKQLKRRIIPFVSTLGPAIVTLRREPGTAISLLRREIKYGMRVIVDQQRSLAVINRPADLHAGGRGGTAVRAAGLHQDLRDGGGRLPVRDAGAGAHGRLRAGPDRSGA